MSDSNRVQALEEKSLELERQVEELDQVVRGMSDRLDLMSREIKQVRIVAAEIAQESETAPGDA